MFSIYFFAWASVAAVLFGVVQAVTGRGFSGLTVLFAIFGFILGWILSLLAMPAMDIFLADSVLLFFILYFMAATLAPLFTGRGSVLPIVTGAFAAAGIAVFAFATTFSGFHAGRYASLVVPVEAKRDTSIPLIDQTQARLVTPELARKRAAELISSSDEQGIGSRVVIGDMWGNEINGTMWWIAPLEHSSFFRWLRFGTTPGYMMVSQYSEMNSKFVQDKPIKIGVNAWFSDNIYRRLYMHGLIDYEYGEAVFQVDDNGNPFWVVPLLYPQVGFSGYMPAAWALVDAMDGNIEVFKNPQDMPEWIDRIYPQDIIAARFDDWGCLGQGWVACTFTGQNVIQSTPGISVTIDPKGDIVYYSGTQFANAKSEGASSGVYVANARTGDVVFYPRAGITETAAKDVLTQAYANYEGYSAADPVLLSVNGHEAYFSVILDSSGVRKGFAIVAQDNRNIIGTGVSVQAAVTEFTRSLQRSRRDLAFEPSAGAPSEEIEGLVVTYLPYVQDGRTVFYVSIDTLPNKILEISEEKVGEIVATRVGDPVRVRVDNLQPGIVYVSAFDNLRINLAEEGIQPIVDERLDAAVKRYEEAKKRADAEALLDGLSAEELDRLLEALRNGGGAAE